jgi:hypothetical protein
MTTRMLLEVTNAEMNLIGNEVYKKAQGIWGYIPFGSTADSYTC